MQAGHRSTTAAPRSKQRRTGIATSNLHHRRPSGFVAAPITGSSNAGSPCRATTWGEPVVISGAGVAGLATALALTKVGIPVRVFESGSGLRQEGTALSFWGNAWRALDALGMADTLRQEYLPLTRFEFCSAGGEMLREFELSECDMGPTGSEVRGVVRSRLLEALYESIPDRERVVTFNAAVKEVLPAGQQQQQQGGGGGGGEAAVAALLSDGRTVYGSALVGADGVGSVVARHLQLPALGYAGYVAYRGVLPIEGAGGDFGSGSKTPGGLRLDTIRQVWGAGVRAGMYPITPYTLYWFTCVNVDESDLPRLQASSPDQGRRNALESVKGWAWDIEEAILRTPPEDISFSRISDRWTAGTVGRGVVTLAGDSAHPMTPNLGQGGAMALEDAVVLGRKLGALAAKASNSGGGRPSASAVSACLRDYEAERSRRCLPLTVRSNVIGVLSQNPLPPVCLARNLFIRTAFQPSHFLDHAKFDCGSLTTGA